MNLIHAAVLICLVSVFAGCAILQEPEVTKHENIENYSYALLPNTRTLVSSTGGVYGNEYGFYGGSATKEVNPRDVIGGILLKRGVLSTETVQPEHRSETLLVKYGESGRRDVAGGLGGYTLEVTIVMVAADTNEVVYSCVAEGQGETEADDIRKAIHRCLSGV